MAKRYVANAQGPSGAHVVEVWVDGEFSGVLTHHVKHSPTGFSWGYHGSGPAELARCLLIDHLGDDAWCKECGGEGRAAWRDNGTEEGEFVPASRAAEDDETVGVCTACWGERTSFGPSLYQSFKAHVVATMPQEGEWVLRDLDIGEWLARRAPTESR